MRSELKIIELIEKYLTNKLTPKERIAFELSMKKDAELSEKVEAQRNIIEATKRIGLKKSTQRSYKNWKTKRMIKQGLIGLFVTSVIVALGMYLMTNSSDKKQITTPNFNTEFTAKDSISNFSNTQLEKEVYQISTTRDTIIETKDGAVFYIPENAFNTESKMVDLVVQTAIKPEDILLAGLSTTSNGKTLETGGMFYIDAFVNGNRVFLTKELTIDIPTSKKKENMKLYKGEKTKEGEINWVAPSDLESFLTPVDILTLDFYPPNYEDSLDSWSNYDKKFKDSLYYSFLSTDYLGEISFEENEQNDNQGEVLFKNNCSSCHKIDANSTGPKLKGARKRWKNYGESASLIYDFIKNPQNLIESGKSKRAVEISNFSMMQMPPSSLTEYEISLILNYADKNLIPNCVNPSTIKTIWNKEFNNTILATKEFEERMPFIHNSCNNEVLETYINNLDKPLSQIDSMVLPLIREELKEQFILFSKRGDGRVELSSKAAVRLANYYARKQRMITEALVKTQKDYLEKQEELDRNLSKKIQGSSFRNLENTNEIFFKEFEKNLCKVYHEVNYPYDCKYKPIQEKYTVKILNLGWNNIDREVLESTVSRTTKTINYKGSSSTLTYNEWSAEIKGENDYNRVFVYNVPIEFNSYIKLYKKGGNYSYNLNNDLKYKTIVIGWIDDKTYYAKEKSIKGHSIFDLKQIDKQKLMRTLKKELGDNEQSKVEVNFIKYVQKDQKRLNKRERILDLKNKIEPIIFPCFVRTMVVKTGIEGSNYN